MSDTDRTTLVLVHGFMDDAAVWAPIRSRLESDVDVVAIDMAGGSGDPTAAGPFTMDRFVADVTTAIDAIDGPVVLVGHSMGTQISELAAAQRTDKIRALVLLTPIPLAGTHMPAEMSDGMKMMPSAPMADQREGRLGLGPQMPSAELDRLLTAGLAVPASTVGDVLDVWDRGNPKGQEPSEYTGPVLILPGELDPFATAEIVAEGVTSRFSNAEVVPVPAAGHWPHAENPAFVATQLDTFIGAGRSQH